MRNETTISRSPYLVYAKFGLVFTAILFISFLFPSQEAFNLSFDLNQPWSYDNLVAPFDVPIKKTEKELESEQKEMEATIIPIYDFLVEVESEVKKDYELKFASSLSSAQQEGSYVDLFEKSEVYKKLGNDCIEHLYLRGILKLNEKHQNSSKGFEIKIKKEEEIVTSKLADLTTVANVDEKIVDFLFKSPLQEAEFLLPILKSIIVPNIQYNQERSEAEKNRLIATIDPTEGFIPRGELIVSKGADIDESVFQRIVSYKEAYNITVGTWQNRAGSFLGYLLLTSLLFGIFLLFLKINATKVYDRFLHLAFMLMWLVLYAYLVYVVEMNPSLSTYLIPFCIVPIVVRVFYNDRIALFTHIIVVLIASFLSKLGYEFTFLQILAGIVAIFTRIEGRNWSRFFYSMIFIFLAYALGYLGLSLIKTGSILQLDWQQYRWFFLSVFLTLLAYPLIPLLERLFQFTSTFSLVELSDMNQPLLKDLSLKAPGTFQHSLQVSNLAEAAASKIGANSLLVKVAALYHDIGKIVRPEFFIENQSGTNPHAGLSELESAKIIIDHVQEGLRLAAQHKLPANIVDFIKTHHGTTLTEYFYRNYLAKHPEGKAEQEAFRYPGPRPSSKEETILMLADSIEAAAKSMQNPSEKDITELVEQISGYKIASAQLQESRLTFTELEKCKEEFKNVLLSMYHVRISYPDPK